MTDLQRYSSDLESYDYGDITLLGPVAREVRAANRYVARREVRMSAKRRVTEAALDAVADVTETAMDCAETIVQAARSRANNDPLLLRALADLTDDGVRDLRRVRARFTKNL